MSASIVVTDADTSAGLACIRELGQSGFTVYATGSAGTVPASKSRFTRAYQSLPNPWTEPQNSFEKLLKFARQVGAQALLPVSEATVAATVRWENHLNSEICLLRANKTVLSIALSKIETFRRCQQLEIPVAPGQVVATDTPPPEWMLSNFPLVIRTDNRWLLNGSYAKGQTWIVRNPFELWAIDQEMKSLSVDYLIQKWVPGSGCGAFLLMHQGQPEISYTHERLAEIPWTGGVSARRRLGYDSELLSLADRFLKGLNLNGIAMLEFRKIRGSPEGKETSNLPILIEMNARPWGSMSLALSAQLPLISRWLRQSTGQPSQDSIQAPKRRPEPWDCGLVTTSLYPGELLFAASVFRSWRKSQVSLSDAYSLILTCIKTLLNFKTKYDFFRMDDPHPGIIQGLNLLSRLMAAFKRRLGRATRTFVCLPLRMARQTAQRVFIQSSEQDRKSSILCDMKIQNPRQILVLCRGNRCRSPFVEQLLSVKLTATVSIISRGLDVQERDVPQRFTKLFLAYGLDPGEHRARRVTRSDVDSADLVVIMEKEHLRHLVKTYGRKILKKSALLSELGEPSSHSDIRDPFNLDPIEAAREFRRIDSLVKSWLSRHTHTNAK